MDTYNRLENAYLLLYSLNDKRTIAISRLYGHFDQAQKDFSLSKINQEDFAKIEIGVLKKICMILGRKPLPPFSISHKR